MSAESMPAGGNLSETIRFSLEREPIETIETLWKGFDRIGDHSFFLTWTWIGTWLNALSPEFAPQLLTARLGQEVIGAAILVPRRAGRHRLIGTRQLHFNSTGERALDCVMIEHNGFAGVKRGDHALWRALVHWFATGSSGADELVVPGVEQAVANSLTGEELLFMTHEVPAFRRQLPQLADGGGIETKLGRNARQKLRRSLRDYGALGEVRIDEAGTLDAALEYFEALKDLHVRSWTRRGKPHAFRFIFFERFHRALIACGIAEGSVQLLRIAAGGRAIGYLYNFRRRGRIYAYQSGFDASNSAMRPGYVCHALAIGLNAEQGAEEYDFLAGHNRLKRSLGPDRYGMSWCSLRRRKLKFRAEMAARSVIRRIAGHPC